MGTNKIFSDFCGQRLYASLGNFQYAQKRFFFILSSFIVFWFTFKTKVKWRKAKRTNLWLNLWNKTRRGSNSIGSWCVLCVGTSSKTPTCCRVATVSARNVCRAAWTSAGTGVRCAGRASRRARRSLTAYSAASAVPTSLTHYRESRKLTARPSVNCTRSRWSFTARRTSSPFAWSVSPCTTHTPCAPWTWPFLSVRYTNGKMVLVCRTAVYSKTVFIVRVVTRLPWTLTSKEVPQ